MTLNRATGATPWWQAWRTRIDANFRLSVATLFSAITVCCVAPFAVYRFVTGSVLIGSIDLMIMGSICLLIGYAWRTGNVGRAVLLMCISNSVGCVLVGLFAGLPGLLWMSPTVMANFLLVGRRSAGVISLVAIVTMAISTPALTSPLQQCMFVASAAVVSLFAYVYAARAELQRHQLEAIAVNDPLTGAYNRRNLDAEMAVAMAASVRNGVPLGLAVLDLDHFKAVNDDFGHDVGDEVLIRFCELVRRTTRNGDRFFRLGGEEFALLLPGADAPALRAMAEKLRVAIERGVRSGDRAVTVSIGATSLAAGETAAEFLARADAAMYRAKHAGRNRVVIEDAAWQATGEAPEVEPIAR